MATFACRYGAKCNRKDTCKFAHPEAVESDQKEMRVCKFGAGCTKRDSTCKFVHPDAHEANREGAELPPWPTKWAHPDRKFSGKRVKRPPCPHGDKCFRPYTCGFYHPDGIGTVCVKLANCISNIDKSCRIRKQLNGLTKDKGVDEATVAGEKWVGNVLATLKQLLAAGDSVRASLGVSDSSGSSSGDDGEGGDGDGGNGGNGV